jgi:hypothetical protein
MMWNIMGRSRPEIDEIMVSGSANQEARLVGGGE